MPDISVVQQPVAVTDSAERDTLPTIDRVSLREHLVEALTQGAPPGHGLGGTELEVEEDQRVTEPSVDTMLLRDALLAVGNNHGQ